jgi:hypothetical protein
MWGARPSGKPDGSWSLFFNLALFLSAGPDATLASFDADASRLESLHGRPRLRILTLLSSSEQVDVCCCSCCSCCTFCCPCCCCCATGDVTACILAHSRHSRFACKRARHHVMYATFVTKNGCKSTTLTPTGIRKTISCGITSHL